MYRHEFNKRYVCIYKCQLFFVYIKIAYYDKTKCIVHKQSIKWRAKWC